jgi:precorrin-6B methylase 2
VASASSAPSALPAVPSTAGDATDGMADAGDLLERMAGLRWAHEHRGDVVYVPTPQKVVDKMLELAHLQKADLLYDLGCGDGRIVVTAAKKYGVHAVGFDIDPDRVREARENVHRSGVGELVTIRRADVFHVDLSPATVVTIYLLPRLNVKLIPQLEKLADGSRIVSHDFDIEGARPDGQWVLKASYFGQANEYYDAGVPEDPAHYRQVEHHVYLWKAPLKMIVPPAP